MRPGRRGGLRQAARRVKPEEHGNLRRAPLICTRGAAASGEQQPGRPARPPPRILTRAASRQVTPKMPSSHPSGSAKNNTRAGARNLRQLSGDPPPRGARGQRPRPYRTGLDPHRPRPPGGLEMCVTDRSAGGAIACRGTGSPSSGCAVRLSATSSRNCWSPAPYRRPPRYGKVPEAAAGQGVAITSSLRGFQGAHLPSPRSQPVGICLGTRVPSGGSLQPPRTGLPLLGEGRSGDIVAGNRRIGGSGGRCAEDVVQLTRRRRGGELPDDPNVVPTFTISG